MSTPVKLWMNCFCTPKSKRRNSCMMKCLHFNVENEWLSIWYTLWEAEKCVRFQTVKKTKSAKASMTICKFLIHIICYWEWPLTLRTSLFEVSLHRELRLMNKKWQFFQNCKNFWSVQFWHFLKAEMTLLTIFWG